MSQHWTDELCSSIEEAFKKINDEFKFSNGRSISNIVEIIDNVKPFLIPNFIKSEIVQIDYYSYKDNEIPFVQIFEKELNKQYDISFREISNIYRWDSNGWYLSERTEECYLNVDNFFLLPNRRHTIWVKKNEQMVTYG